MKKNPVVHFEMPYTDKKRLAGFYTKVFGWNMHILGENMGGYVLAHTTETDENNMVKNPGNINGGFYPKGEYGTTHVVISVDNLAKHMEMIKKSGGKILGEPIDIPEIGKFVMFTDTEDNKVGMLQPIM